MGFSQNRCFWAGVLDSPHRNLVTVKDIMAKRIEIDAPAPDFELADFSGRSVRLADYRERRHIVLVFNRGFV
jgi:hypothetical protein